MMSVLVAIILVATLVPTLVFATDSGALTAPAAGQTAVGSGAQATDPTGGGAQATDPTGNGEQAIDPTGGGVQAIEPTGADATDPIGSGTQAADPTGADPTVDGVVATEDAASAPQGIVTALSPITPAGSGEVSLISFTIANNATNPPSSTTTTYTTHSNNTAQATVRGTYEIQQNDVSDALVTITLQNKDDEGYFGSSYNYFTATDNDVSWPVGSANHSVTPTDDGNGTVVSFTVSGNDGDTGSFIIGFNFNAATFGGWLPKGKLIAEVTSGGDIISPKMLTLTATNSEGAGISFSSLNSYNIGLDQIAQLQLDLLNNNGVQQWLYEPGTPVFLTLDYPTGAQVTIPPRPAMVTTTVNGDTTQAYFDLGTVQSDGREDRAIWTSGNYIYYRASSAIALAFPTGSFDVGATYSITASLTSTFAGQTEPTTRIVTLNFTIADLYIHMQPANLTLIGGNPNYVTLDIDGDASTTGNSEQFLSTSGTNQAINNGGTLPIPETCLTWENGFDSVTNKVNVSSLTVANFGALFKTEAVVTVDGPNGHRTATFILPAAANLSGTATVSAATLASALALQTGEYISQIQFYPLTNDITESAAATTANPVHGLPVSAGIRPRVVLCSWPGGVFPDGTPIKQNDAVHNRLTLSWQGESMPDTITSSTVISKTDGDASGGTTVVMQNLISDVGRTIYYGRNPIYPQVSLTYQSGQAGSKLPGQTLGMNLNIGSNYRAFSPWIDPIVYWIPPASLTIDPGLIGAPLDVYAYASSGTALGARTAGAVATITQTTLGGQAAYRIAVTGVSIPRSTASFVYSIPLTLVVAPNTAPGNYWIYTRTGAPTGTTNRDSGLLFGTTDAPHSIIYPENDYLGTVSVNTYNDNTTQYDATLTNNEGQRYLITQAITSCPAFTVSSLSKLDVSAQLLNNTAGDVWQDVFDPGAEATVNTTASGHGDFRLTLTNSGNSYVGDIRLLDILPFLDTTNERTVLNPTAPKGSEWTATLKAAPTVTILDENGENVTSYFTG